MPSPVTGKGAKQLWTLHHLEWNVGYALPEQLQPAPGALVQEAQGHVKGGPPPHLQGGGLLHHVGGGGGGLQHVVGAHARSQQTLVGVTPAGARRQPAQLCRPCT